MERLTYLPKSEKALKKVNIFIEEKRRLFYCFSHNEPLCEKL